LNNFDLNLFRVFGVVHAEGHICRVTIDEEVKYVKEDQSVYVPLGSAHPMENLEKLPMMLIEVKIGTYLGEDVIISYEEVYERQ
jgi:mannose-1-phosphate guanylyltransferase / mannose-6-phosphate isomerase